MENGKVELLNERVDSGGWMWRREGRGGAGVEEQEGLVRVEDRFIAEWGVLF